MKNGTEGILLFDTHAHLDELDDLSIALQEAGEEGIRGIVAVGVDIESNKNIIKMAEANPGFVFPALGYHPWEIKEEEMEENLSFIQDHLETCIALGEIGLDYKGKVKKELQWRVFGQLLKMARQSKKPAILHSRFSHHRTFEMVKEHGVERAVFHWYSGPLDLLEKILREGYFISATPALAYSPPHQEAIKRAPLERILLETDSPVSYQGREARPKDVWITLENVARLKGLDPIQVSKQTMVNASEFFEIQLYPVRKPCYLGRG